jgi:hypothetical protein
VRKQKHKRRKHPKRKGYYERRRANKKQRKAGQPKFIVELI